MTADVFVEFRRTAVLALPDILRPTDMLEELGARVVFERSAVRFETSKGPTGHDGGSFSGITATGTV